MADPQKQPDAAPPRRRRSFRRTVISGLGVLMPPLLTIVIFVWVGSTINQNVLRPVEDGVRNALVWRMAEIRTPPWAKFVQPQIDLNGRTFIRLESAEYVPQEIVQYVKTHSHGEPVPASGQAVYERYVELRFLRPEIIVPVFVCTFLLLTYLLGKFLAAGVGTFVVGFFERGIGRLPLVRHVYSSVKQVTDFMLAQKKFDFTRVVAVEYPCKGVWSVGFVTSESLSDIRAAANEPVVAVLVPCSPMPMAARSVVVRKREVVELHMTVDQALQFIVSCGVVVPPQQRTNSLKMIEAANPLAT